MESRTMRMVRTGAPAALLLAVQPVFAGGGGQNMLLVVNPNDESSLRIANAYAKLRAIPASNFVYVTPEVNWENYTKTYTSETEVTNRYITPVANAISGRGLTNQIDYIGTLGLNNAFNTRATIGADGANSVTYALSLTTPLSSGQITYSDDGYSFSPLYQQPSGYTKGTNTAIHHSTEYWSTFRATESGPYKTDNYQFYMAGAIGVTSQGGNAPSEVIRNLQRSVAADGTKPVGTVYFEDSGDIYRSTTARKNGYNNYLKPALDARGIATVMETPASPNQGLAPKNRTDVLGVIAGGANLPLPNGSTYLAGSFADNLTSAGGAFNDRGQTKSSMFLTAGAAATYGAVVEPYNGSYRFAHAMVHAYVADGSTMAEAYAKSVYVPDVQMFMGDMLAQPFADIPSVNITSGPASGATVSSTVSISATGSLTGASLATGVAKLQLFIDGKPAPGVSDIAGNTGTFSLDTTLLSDGQHEVRVVAINNAAAESQGLTLRNINVDNLGRSVTPASTSLSLGDKELKGMSVSAAAGSGTVSRIELRSLGRSLGQITSSSGSIQVDASKLAYGENTLVPVAVFSDNSEVAGTPINVTRNPTIMAGKTPTSPANRQPGIKTEYFIGRGGTNVVGSDYSGTPDVVAYHGLVNLHSDPANPEAFSSGGLYEYMTTDGITNFDKLGVRMSGKFSLTETGEYQFYFWQTNDCAVVYIDGVRANGWDYGGGNGNMNPEAPSLFLGAGEHELLILATNTMSDGAHGNMFDISAQYRGPDGINRIVDSGLMYQAVPEPTTLGLVILGAAGLLRRARKSRTGLVA